MKNKKTVLSGLLAALTVSACFAGCSDTGGSGNDASPAPSQAPSSAPSSSAPAEKEDETPSILNETGFPIVNESITLTAMSNPSPAQPPDWNDIYVWQEYEKMTGIHIDWQLYSSDLTEKRNLALASNELPDLFYKSRMPDNDIAKYGAEGSFLQLNDLIDRYAPNYQAITEKYEDVKKGVPMADGIIYALPCLSDEPSVEIGRKLFLNQKWLKKAGKQSPTTTDELYDVLKAFKAGDGNGNGQADEIPLSSDSLDDIITTLRGSFGLGNRGTGNGNWDIDPDTRQLRYFPASNSYQKLMEYLHMLYSEGLIDQEIFTNDGKKVLAKNEQELLGAFTFSNTVARANTNESDFSGLTCAIKGPDGDQMFTGVRGHIASRGAFLISKTNPYPEASMRWVDYFYSDEGVKMMYLGVEGVSYQKTADGSFEFLPEIVNNIPEGSSFDQVVSKYVPYAGGAIPTITIGQYFKGGETQPTPKTAADNMVPYLPEEVWAPFSFTAEESEQKAAIETDLNDFIKQRTAEFVQGKTPISDFDNFVKQIEQMGLEDLKAIYTAAYERYQNN